MTAAKETTGSRESRLGKRPVAVPAGVTITIDGNKVTAKGPKGEFSKTFRDEITLKKGDSGIVIGIRPGVVGKRGPQFQGLTRALVRNMVKGVHEGYKKSLDLRGVGYRCEHKEGALHMTVGTSHAIVIPIPKTVSVKIETIDEVGMKYPRVTIESFDNELLGQIAAKIRYSRPPEPYKGKGIRYTGEKVREKAGKAGKAAGGTA